MYTQHSVVAPRRNGSATRDVSTVSVNTRYAQVVDELRACGFNPWGLIYSECRELPTLLRSDEHIRGAIYGHNESGRALLVATDERLVFIDKKPLFLKVEEITYDMITGLSFFQGGLSATVILHTRIGDYSIKTMNKPCAIHFRDYMELHALKDIYDTRRQP